jgi:hypothetical protein
VNAGEREIAEKKKGEKNGSARGSLHWGCYYATALDIEVVLNAAALAAASPTLLLRDW